MDAGLSAAQFSEMAAAVSRTCRGASEEPIAVVRCVDGWRTLFADGSSHQGSPCSRPVMGELARLVDRWRADDAELAALTSASDRNAAPARESPDLAASSVRETRGPSGAAEPTPQLRPTASGGQRGQSFVPWSVVETMIDVELDGYFRRLH